MWRSTILDEMCSLYDQSSLKQMMHIFKEHICLYVFLFSFPMLSLSACGSEHNIYLEEFDIIDNDTLPFPNRYEANTIIVAQWNIGHFSGGKSPNSNIKGDLYEQKKLDFKELISDLSADIISINEYSEYLGIDENDIKQKANSVLFQDYTYQMIGHQSRYSCNAVFSRVPFVSIKEIPFNCNQNAIITHTNAIKATDYYYIEAMMGLSNKNVKFISTHLAFDNNNPEIARNQIIELIDNYRYEDYVIICGDWNITDVSFYDLFLDAGFEMANHGPFGDFITYGVNKKLDNIIVKGLSIESVDIVESSLSDHRPLYAKIRVSE